MSIKPTINGLLLAAIIPLLAGCTEPVAEQELLPYYADTTLTPLWVELDSLDVIVPHRVDEVRGIDQAGRTIDENLFEGKITVVDFFFTRCPNICPTLTENMVRIQDAFADEDRVGLVSLSVTPHLDSVSVLRRYADQYGVDDRRWRMITGDRNEIYLFARESLFADIDTTADDFLHSETFYLVGPDRRIRGIYNGTLGAEIVNLIGDIERLLEEIPA